MRFTVCVKQVPDTTLIEVDGDGHLVREGVPSILDPCSEHALETALRLKRDGDVVTVVCMGPDQASEALKTCLELGADEAYLLSDRAFAGADVHATCHTLKAFIEKTVPDTSLILCGKQASDGDTAQVPAELAQTMGRQQFCYVVGMERDGCSFTAVQDYTDETRVCRVPEGSVVSVSDCEPNRRLPSIARLMEVSGMEIVRLDRIALGLGNYSVGTKGSRTRIVRSEAIGRTRAGNFIDGSDPGKAAEFIKGLF